MNACRLFVLVVSIVAVGCSETSSLDSSLTPSISVKYPPDATVDAGWSVYFSGTCTAGAGDVEISGDATATATCESDAWSVSVDISGLSVGSVSLSVTQTNSLGVSADAVTRTLNKTNASCDSSSARSNSPFASGTGVNSSDPYIICTAAQLAEVPGGTLTKYYKIASDIDLSGTAMGRIGTDSGMFTGGFDGGGFSIYNFTLTLAADYVGLFGYVDAGAVITDVHLVDVSINSTGTTVGGLIGIIDNAATVSKSSVTGTVTGATYTGGFIGVNNSGTITESFANVTVTGEDGTGGFVGDCDSSGSITDSYSLGSVSGQNYVGGFAGVVWGTLTRSFSTGSVTVSGTDPGGFVGDASGALVKNYWDQETSGWLTSDGSGSNQAEAKTTTEMKTQSTYTGYTFPGTWKTMDGTDYPHLAWEP